MTGLPNSVSLRPIALAIASLSLFSGTFLQVQSSAAQDLPAYRPDDYRIISQPSTLSGATRMDSRTIASHELVPVRLIIERPATRDEFVTETEYTTREVTRTKPVWETETRYREVERRIPREIERTITQTQTVEKPVIERTYRDEAVTETSMREFTEYEQQRHIVQRPVTRTEYRDETVVVEKPVERTVYQTENVTSYRPVTQTQTVYSPALIPVQQTAPVAASTAPSLKWMNRGYVNDPITNQQVWQRGGLHWVRPDPATVCAVPQTTYMQSLIPQQQTSTAYVPEVTQQLKPVTISETVRNYETRRVPLTVETTESSIELREVPVTRLKPVTETTVRRVPVDNLRYESKLITREIPIRETVYETVRETEPYEVKVYKEVVETSTVQEPREVKKLVVRNYTERIVRDVYVRIPLDENDERTFSIDREMNVQLDSSTAKIPANDSIVDLDFFRNNTTTAKPAVETSGVEPLLDSGSSKTIVFTPVPPREGMESASSKTDDSAEPEAEKEFIRGILPETKTPVADQVPALKPSDAIGG